MKLRISQSTGDVFKSFPFRVINTRNPLKRLDERMVFEKRLYINSKLTPSDKLRRIVKRNEERKILMVISDGAPVDDSTISSNSSNYLEKHLKKVIDMIQNESNVEIIAIGIGHDVSKYYKKAVTIHDPDQLGGVMVEKFSELFKIKK